MKTKIGKILEFLKNEFVYGGHLLSLGAASIVFTAAVLLDIHITWDFLLIAYLVTYIDYSYDRMVGLKHDILTNPLRTRHINSYIKFFPAIILAAALMIAVIMILYGNLYSILLVFLMILGGLLYATSFKKMTQKITGFKSLYVSLVWSSLIVLLSLYYDFPLNVAVILIFLFVFLRWLINVSFCDLKDLEADRKMGLLTFAAVMGEDNLLLFLTSINIISITPIMLGIYFGVLPRFSIFLGFLLLYSFYHFYRAKRYPSKINHTSDVLADSEFVLWSFFVILGKIIIC